jgi:hypothetical protein
MSLKKEMRGNRIGFILVVMALMTVSCNRHQGVTEEAQKIPISNDSVTALNDTTISELFDEFYQFFNENTSFQKTRIKYPIPGEFFDGTRTNTENINYMWTEKDSLAYNTFGLDSTYKLERPIVTDSLVVEKVFIPNSGFQMRAHFKKISGRWFLVYYSYVDA